MAARELDLMLAAPLEPLKVGQDIPRMPAHLTVLPWFRLPESDWPEFSAELEDLAIEEAYPIVIGGEPAKFGPEGDIQVRKLGGVLLGVHTHAYKIARSFDVELDPTYTGLRYVPHIADKPDGSVAQDERIRLQQLAVLERDEVGRRVRATYKFRSFA